MDLIRISDSKLKIMLTSTDMTHYNLHTDSISIADQHVRRVLQQLLIDAKAQTGFDGDVSHLYVQMFPSADGGCELFISKPDTKTEARLPVLQQKGRIIAPERHGHDVTVYSFSCLAHLILVCKRLSAIGFSGNSNVYADSKHTYYLVLCDLPTHSLYSLDEYCFLGEYGCRENARTLHAYLAEYCTLICQGNAVAVLMQL